MGESLMGRRGGAASMRDIDVFVADFSVTDGVTVLNGQLDTNAREVIGIAGQELSALAVGSEIYLIENGMAVRFIVLSHGYPTSNRTLLLRKDAVTASAYNATSTFYVNGTADVYLTGVYYNSLSSTIKAMVAPVAIDVTTGRTNTPAAVVTSIQRPIFLLSGTEVGAAATYLGVNVLGTEGSAIPYFSSNALRICYYNGGAVRWYTRSTSCFWQSTSMVFIVKADGSVTNAKDTGTTDFVERVTSLPIRPALTLPYTAKVTSTADISGVYSLL